jgi:hypothetical protein
MDLLEVQGYAEVGTGISPLSFGYKIGLAKKGLTMGRAYLRG